MSGRVRPIGARGTSTRGDDDSSDEGEDGGSSSFSSDHWGNDHDRADGTSSMRAEKEDSPEGSGDYFDHYHQDGPDHEQPVKESKSARQGDRNRLGQATSGSPDIRYDVGIGFGAGMMGGTGAAVGLAAGGDVELSMGDGGVSLQGGVGAFTPIVGIGVVVGKVGPSLEVGASWAPVQTSTSLCQSKTLIVTPFFSLAVSGDQVVDGISASFGVSVGAGVFSGVFCGFNLDTPSWQP